MIFNCPGSQKFKQPQPEMIKCPYCGTETEIWTDETVTRCPECKKYISHKRQQSCLDWCKYVNECIGKGGGKNESYY